MPSPPSPCTGRRAALVAAGALGALAVAAGAFGAHALEGRLSPRMAEVWSIAARYHMWHALALLATAAAPLWPGRLATAAAVAWTTGVVLFSGSLYLLAITGLGTLGAVAPFGGVILIAGWVLLALAAASLAPGRGG
jgi:uncharacterized membrane protein YgdD (TMEM256/DUF423 family)